MDSWTGPISNGERMLYGAAAREYRLSLMGGVDGVIAWATERATRDALAIVNGISSESLKPGTAAARPARSNSTRRVSRTRRERA